MRLNIAGIRCMIENENIDKGKWIASKDQLEDPLTKRRFIYTEVYLYTY